MEQRTFPQHSFVGAEGISSRGIWIAVDPSADAEIVGSSVDGQEKRGPLVSYDSWLKCKAAAATYEVRHERNQLAVSCQFS